MTAQAREVVAALTERHLTLAVAESLTGGALADALVSVPGASGCLRGAVVAYATDLKHSLLGVPEDLLRRHGAVHPDVARAMAEGVRSRLGADVGIATTGVAGPEEQDGRPVGEVHVAVCDAVGCEVLSLREDASAGRSGVRAAAVRAALMLVLRRVRHAAAPGE